MDGEDSGKTGSSISIRMLAMQEAFADPFQQGPYSMEQILRHRLTQIWTQILGVPWLLGS